MKWEETFTWNGKSLRYNLIPYNNTAERAIEIPIILDFLSKSNVGEKLLEVGNVLCNYENEYNKISRTVVDKYEVAADVVNIDLMDVSALDKYDLIVSISTVEHIGQNWDNFECSIERDLEAPLKAIVKIYTLLNLAGRAIITVPFGKFTDGIWYIQFNQDYLERLTKKYKLPEVAIQVSYFKRIASEVETDNPYQIWIQTNQDELKNVCYDSPYSCANGLAVIELKNSNLIEIPEKL
ncbi:MAG: hypothetical protein KME46_16035 [Brasilonema angustatum HA4187-MV1]|jgi:hypothetical protein|nr:hypothetical protein [Brasilonema angustatum HA4187-MV1]